MGGWVRHTPHDAGHAMAACWFGFSLISRDTRVAGPEKVEVGAKLPVGAACFGSAGESRFGNDACAV